MWRDEAWRGRAGQAFELGEPGVVDGTTANSLAASYRGPRQDGQVAKTKLLARSCLRIWTRAWGQREPADERTGRLKKPGTMAGLAQGWAGHPFHSRQMQLTSHGTPAPDVGRAAIGSRAGRIGIFVFHPIAVSFNDDRLPVMHQPVDQGRGQGVVHVKQGAPFPEGSIRGQHDRSGFITGSDHLEQQIGPALVDGQIAQLIEEEKGGTDVGFEGFAQQAVDLGRGQVIDHVDHARIANANSHAHTPCNPMR